MIDVRFRSKADLCGATGHVCFTPESDAECVHSLPARADAKWSFYEQCQIKSEVNEGFTGQGHYAGLRAQAHVQLAGRQGRTESKVVRAPLQGPAGYISICCARTRAWSAVHTPDAAARDRILLACASHPRRSPGAHPSCSKWATARLDLADQPKSKSWAAGDIPNPTGSVQRARLQLGSGLLLRLRAAGLSTRLA